MTFGPHRAHNLALYLKLVSSDSMGHNTVLDDLRQRFLDSAARDMVVVVHFMLECIKELSTTMIL